MDFWHVVLLLALVIVILIALHYRGYMSRCFIAEEELSNIMASAGARQWWDEQLREKASHAFLRLPNDEDSKKIH